MNKFEQINDMASIISHLSHFTTNEDIAKKLYDNGYRKVGKGHIVTTKDKIKSKEYKAVKNFSEKLNQECIENSYYDDDMKDMVLISGNIGIVDIYRLLKEWENENR